MATLKQTTGALKPWQRHRDLEAEDRRSLKVTSNMRASKTHRQRFFSLCGVLSVLQLVCGSEEPSQRCQCPAATVLEEFPLHLPNDTCCLNFTGSSFNNLTSTAFSPLASLQVLDLSSGNLSHIHDINMGFTFPALRELYLGHNQLTSVPSNFLANAHSLEVLDLGRNLMKDLPVDFLQNSNSLRVLLLDGNSLQFLPSSILKPSLQQLDLMDNPWNCTCSLVEELQKARPGNFSNWDSIVDNLTCVSPPRLAGESVWSVQTKEVCPQAHSSLTALFILLPLFLLLVLLFFWCCGKKGTKTESHKKDAHTDRNGRWAQEKLPFGEKGLPRENTRDAMLKNQLMLRPSSALLGSTRDIYEEVEVKLGSVDSLGPPHSASSTEGIVGKEERGRRAEEDKQDLDTVSVTEVMKDSANREKAYMTQSTKYYSLVPGLELEDSDHGDYESVDLS